jgi:hypothetical protein
MYHLEMHCIRTAFQVFPKHYQYIHYRGYKSNWKIIHHVINCIHYL